MRSALRFHRPLAILTFAVLLAASAAAAGEEAAGVKPTPAFDVTALDRSADPCVDFYKFSCGGWMASNPLPADEPLYGRFNALNDRNLETLKGIVEKAAKGGAGNSVDRMIGDLYESCMDDKKIEEKGLSPIEPTLKRIAGMKGKADLASEIALLHASGVNVLFRFRSQQDQKDATSVIAAADQGGLGLPDRDYYFKEDPRSVDIRGKYVAHVQKMFELAGEKPESAAARAKTVMEIETALAKVSMERVKRRDPDNVYHKMPLKEFALTTPTFGWDAYLKGATTPPIDSLNVAVPDFFKGLESVIGSNDLESLKTYLRWQTLHAGADLLPKAFQDENFDFYGKTLSGAQEIRPRWKRCVEVVDGELGEALGQRYVEITFGSQGKERTLKMVLALEKALGEDIKTLPWMTEATKKQAFTKLGAIANKIGYPDKWRDYGSVQIKRDDLVGNIERAEVFEFRRQVAKIGKPVDRQEWFMSPPTVNAYYSSNMNDINFPAGILQPPFYDNAKDDAVNFGGIGAVIGHELTHGFDDSGRKFDAKGNRADWWTEQDGKEFESRASCFVDQYAGYSPVADVKLNGKLTLGENVADGGGLRIAHMALQDMLGGKSPAPIDGFTPDQRLFISWGQVWCQNSTDEIMRMLAQVDPHSPGQFRVNGVVANMPEFAKAFQCKPGSPMVRENPCQVW